ncbi:hypothetical protein JQC72_06575 [Polycladomyces sp. WAk]|uniref:DUF5683 domain-containing protein n=1 Tax=Polycladomyces zharkentensis TaxID=2807616 RepID=A0ABS2WI87_9BACL|nr:hypothetical protein [Polycladomyces sp. WAk]
MIKIIISVLLSAVMPGLGQLYNRQKWKAVILISAFLVLGWLNLVNGGLLDEWILLLRIIGALDGGYVGYKIYRGIGNTTFLTTEKAIFQIGLVAVIVIGLSLSAFFMVREELRQEILAELQSPRDLNEVKQEAIQYLEQKYKKKFIAGHANYMPVTGQYTVRAYPEDNRQAKVLVYGYTKRDFQDTYVIGVLSLELKKKVNPIVDQIFGRENLWDSNIGIELGKDLEKKYERGKIPPLQTVLKSEPNQVTATISLSLYDTDPGKQEEEQILRFIKELQALSIKTVTIHIEYFDPNFKEKKDDSNVHPVDYRKFYLGMWVDDLKSIRSEKDLKQFILTDERGK